MVLKWNGYIQKEEKTAKDYDNRCKISRPYLWALKRNKENMRRE